ncbi:DUF3885 domain-containing protein [Marininema halotolerans]|uniref:DUF3885 domain-containing protein n=1 Tax=Marininema halotolerans TaxID=1155944 RepID=A0A1I6PZ93_9BACL|nr:DUF3885 domain-containing protein [Marininema halotolerans]SFS45531.1 protein of unknown function [Marininema halotolerans]
MKKINLDDYMENNFSGLKLMSPLFYNYEIGLRFEMSEEGIKEQVYSRSISLLNELCKQDDELIITIFVDSVEDNPPPEEDEVISYFYRHTNIDNKEVKIDRKTFPYRYSEPSDTDSWTFRYSLQCRTSDVDIKNLLITNANRSFDIEPSLIGNMFIINSSKNIIFFLYDYRGMDIISKSKNHLKDTFIKYNDWILDYDKDRINSIFID